MYRLVFFLLLVSSAQAAPRFHVDRWTFAHAVATAYDGATTANYMQGCVKCYEANPVSRVFIGRRAEPWRMEIVGAAEVLGTAIIPNHKLRHIVQVSLMGAHLTLGTKNLWPQHHCNCSTRK